MIDQVVRCAVLLGVAFGFGCTLKLSDLLQEHGYVWFRGATFVTGCVSALLCVAMLLLGNDALHVAWLAVLLSWLVRGRIDGPNHGVMAGALLLTVLACGPRLDTQWQRFFYFLAVLVPLGVAHDLLQYTSLRAPRAIEWFFEQQHLYWYAMAAGYCLLFELDWLLCACIYGFVKGYGFLYDEARRDRLLLRIGASRAGPSQNGLGSL